MGEDLCPVRRAGQQAVVALPEHMDASNAGQIQQELLSVIDGSATALIADMTATIWCDHAGADAVVRAFRRAVISGTQLRLVVSVQHVRRVLSLSGLDQLVCIYPSLEAATAASSPAAALAVVAGPELGGSRSCRGSAVGYGR
jgi:anti-sigma B factor antagonist